jgi:hypothetical protein
MVFGITSVATLRLSTELSSELFQDMAIRSCIVSTLMVNAAAFAGLALPAINGQPYPYQLMDSGGIDSPNATHFVESVVFCAALCMFNKVCAAFSVKPASSGFPNQLQCSIALGHFTWTPEEGSSLYIGEGCTHSVNEPSAIWLKKCFASHYKRSNVLTYTD